MIIHSCFHHYHYQIIFASCAFVHPCLETNVVCALHIDHAVGLHPTPDLCFALLCFALLCCLPSPRYPHEPPLRFAWLACVQKVSWTRVSDVTIGSFSHQDVGISIFTTLSITNGCQSPTAPSPSRPCWRRGSQTQPLTSKGPIVLLLLYGISMPSRGDCACDRWANVVKTSTGLDAIFVDGV
jgi:hypothetical protein